MKMPIRVLLADDHILFRKGIASLIATRQDMQVVGEARDGLEAIEQARETQPDIVLMDIHMPRATGLEAIPHIIRECPNTRIIMLTVSDDDQDLFTAIKNGAFGYLLKDIEPTLLFAMLAGVQRGEAPIAGTMATKILREIRQVKKNIPAIDPMLDDLTTREAEVLRLVANGTTNREIATALSITENTVKMHLRNILDKLHLQNRIQATAYAVRQGFANPSNSNQTS
jgi:two-component system, NarL family, nitrate/nitrite response regulator NarL